MPASMRLVLKILAPYLAVGVFWCGLSNAWLAILAYHAQILFWRRSDWCGLALRTPQRPGTILVALPCLLTGPLLYWLLPVMTQTDLPTWLHSHHMSRSSLLVMIPYFGLVHPLLEQVHWRGLRDETAWAHPAFAGYHLLVLSSLLPLPWLLLCFVVLVAASVAWQRAAKATGSLAAPVLSHVLADLGAVLAAWARVQ